MVKDVFVKRIGATGVAVSLRLARLRGVEPAVGSTPRTPSCELIG
jgi:hypothetical protein